MSKCNLNSLMYIDMFISSLDVALPQVVNGHVLDLFFIPGLFLFDFFTLPVWIFSVR